MTSAAPPAVVSLLTPPGRGALAVVGVAGADATAFVDEALAPHGGRSIVRRAVGAIAVGSWRSTGEEVVVVRRRADLVEVHCHGGMAAAAAVITSLVALGAEAVPWTHWLAATGEPETAVEAHETLARAGGPKAARILSRQACGALDAEITRITELRDRGEHDVAEAAIGRLLRAARVGLRLERPWRVVLTGPVNAGKSSLVNALAGFARSIVSSAPGTTRDLLETRLVLGGWEVDIVDTAGERDEATNVVERAGMARATMAAADADLVVRVVAADMPGSAAVTAGALLVVSKTDLRPNGGAWPADAVPTSTVAATGIAELTAAIVGRLVPEELAEPDLLAGAVPFTPRQVDVVRRLTRPRTSAASSGHGRGAGSGSP